MPRATEFRRPQAITGLLAAIGLVTGLTAPIALAANPDAIWHVVHDQCATDMAANHKAAPCDTVALAGGYAVLKDLHGATQLLLIPTDRITGIEAPEILAPDAKNYWQDAWAARPIFQIRAPRPVPREDLGLAINSKYGRSQNQLHIHIDCVRPDVRQALTANQGRIGPRWAALDVDLAGHRYLARRHRSAPTWAQPTLPSPGRGPPGPRRHEPRDPGGGGRHLRGRQARLRIAQRPGRSATGAISANSEDLLDPTCKVLG